MCWPLLFSDPREQLITSAFSEDPAKKSGRKVTINNQLRKRRAKGKHIDIKFPKEFAKVCGEHASLFKSEIIVLVRNVPLQVKKWRDMDKFHPGTTASIWRKLKQKFPELSEEDKDCAMRQVESQYNNRRYHLLHAYRTNKPRPQHVSPEDQKRSNQNSINRGNQEMGSKVGTRSIAQTAYDLRDLETGEWPTAMQVWRATYQKADRTWSIPTGEEIMTKLHEAAGTHQEKISSAPVAIVEHFAQVLCRKPNHSRGVGIRAVNRVADERIRLQAQIKASELRELQLEHVQMLLSNMLRLPSNEHKLWRAKFPRWSKQNAQLQEEKQSQRDELSFLRQAQSGEVARIVREQLDHQMAELIARIHSGASQSPSS